MQQLGISESAQVHYDDSHGNIKMNPKSVHISAAQLVISYKGHRPTYGMQGSSTWAAGTCRCNILQALLKQSLCWFLGDSR